MRQPLLLSFFFVFVWVSSLTAQEVRSIDGSGNNLNNPEWGAAGTELMRLAPVGYGNGISSLGGIGRPNPRLVSNTLFAQDTLLSDPMTLSDYCWSFGQFIDHDVTLVPDGSEIIHILVPVGDPWFDPAGTGNAFIEMRRSSPAPATGTGTSNPRQHLNVITSFVDGSAVYGSEISHANWLRTFEGGKLKVSAGNMLPYNTIDGEYDSPIDPAAPHMENPIGFVDKIFVAGDPRVNEQPLLIAFHALFVREHNRLCDSLIVAHPDWTDEELYQHARRLVGGIMQSIVYYEWLPTMGIELPPYSGYDPSINPSISNTFSAAAYRMGHTLLNGIIRRMDLEGNEMPEGDLELKNGFFNPTVLDMGIEPYFKGMATQVQQDFDSKVIDDVRNFLFGPPGAPGPSGLDLATINITRGRERGIPDLNTIRETLGLPVYQNFFQITDDYTVASTLEALYGDVDDIDAWVGMLAEAKMPGVLFGETVMKIMEDQFFVLREGDRFYFENDPAFTPEEIEWLKNTRMGDVIMRNTGIDVMQENVFLAMPHEMLCTTVDPNATITGGIASTNNVELENVLVELMSATGAIVMAFDETDPNGTYDLGEVATCEGYVLQPHKNDDPAAGVTTMDLVVMRNHILGINSFNSPYQYIAADANHSETITTLDIVVIRKVILLVQNNFDNNTSWRFVEASYEFQDPNNPLAEDFPEAITIDNLLESQNINFVAVKIGDLNSSYVSGNVSGEAEERSSEPLVFEVEDARLEQGETRLLAFRSSDIQEVLGFQFTLNYDAAQVELLQVNGGALEGFSAEHYNLMAEVGALNLSWDGATAEIDPADDLFLVEFRALKDDVQLGEIVSINSRYTSAIGYHLDGQPTDVALMIDGTAGDQMVFNKFELYQNVPNPVATTTNIAFCMPQSGQATLTVFDENGRLLMTRTGDFAKGVNRLDVNVAALQNASGILTYRLESDYGIATRKMVVIN